MSASDALALAGLNTLTVSPSHGRLSALFQLTYSISPCAVAAGLNIGFSWGALIARGPADRRQLLGNAHDDSAPEPGDPSAARPRDGDSQRDVIGEREGNAQADGIGSVTGASPQSSSGSTSSGNGPSPEPWLSTNPG